MKKLTVAILCFFIVSHLFARTYFVSTNGNDSNNGSFENTPFLTITKALSFITAGDYIYERGRSDEAFAEEGRAGD